MPRLPRSLQWASEACFHLMNRGHDRERIFADEEDRSAFLGLVARYAARFHFRLYHYCLMDNQRLQTAARTGSAVTHVPGEAGRLQL